ncbi:MAG: Peptidase hyicolysin [Fusobacteriales bacterium]|jgi:hypothetical protein|nr:Peptidase hyicolysin [Fusobacteriales bacterium]
MKKILVYLISVILFSSCNSIFDVFSTSSSNTTLKKDITLTIKNNTNNNYNAYAVFTNEEYYSYAGQIKITSNTISSSLSNYTSSYSANIVSNNEIIKHPTFYDNGELKTEKTVDNNISASIMANTASYSEGDTKEFNALYAGTGDYYTDKDDTNLNKKQATLRKQVSNVSVTLENGGTSKRTLNIWVADDVWGTVTQEMIDTLADKFLQTGENNDIYDYVTSIYGDEWFEGDDKFSNTIYGNKEIDILIYNINEFNTSDAKVLGFFDSRHNYTDYEYSNQEIMFFIDSGYFSLKEGGNWDITYADNSGKGPATILSTLAHEFTHMIMFYQKYYKQGISIDTWINEMCAMITEDIVADKLGISNPINIRQGEFSMYGSSYPVNEWTTTTIHYSNKYFFWCIFT